MSATDQIIDEKPQLAPAEFSAQFEACHGRLWLVASAILGDRHMAEDIVQEAAIVAWTRIDQYEPGTNFAAWMAQIVRLQALNSSRKRTRRKTHNVNPETLDAYCSSAEDNQGLQPSGVLPPDQDFFDDTVMQALEGIDAEARACLLLKIVHQLSYREIAELLGVATGTAMSHVHRSKIQLRKKLATYGTDGSTDAQPRD